MTQSNGDKPNQTPSNESPASKPEAATTSAEVRLEDFGSAAPSDVKTVSLN